MKADPLDSLLKNFDEFIAADVPRFPILSADDLAGMPPAGYAIKHVFPSVGIAAIYGPSSSGKTFLALDMASRCVDGLPWFHYRTRPRPVVYIGLEGIGGLAQRVQAYRIANGDDAGRRVRFITGPLHIMNPQDADELAKSIREAGADNGTTIVDTMNAASPGADENSSADMGRIIAGAKRLQAAVGGLVVLIHHTGKDASRGLRGHSSLLAALDAAIEVTRIDDRREWTIAKAKDGTDGQSHPFKLIVVELGEDEDGEPLTSCVVAPVEAADAAVKRALPPPGGNQRLAYVAISTALKDGRNYGMGKAPPTRPCIELEKAIDAAAACLPCEPKRRRERAQQAITALVSRGSLAHNEGWLWLP